MKRKYQALQGIFFLFVVNLFSVASMAQENTGATEETTTSKTTKTTDINITADGGGEWYTQPWVWVVGAAVFILLLIALMRGGSKSGTSATDRVTVTKTTNVERE